MALTLQGRPNVGAPRMSETGDLARTYALALVTSQSDGKSSAVDPRELMGSFQMLLEEQFQAAGAQGTDLAHRKASQRRRVEEIALRLTTSPSQDKSSVVDVAELKTALMAAAYP